MAKNSFVMLSGLKYRLDEEKEKRVREIVADGDPVDLKGAGVMSNGYIKLFLAIVSILLLVVIVVFVARLVGLGWVEKPEVSIVFNVGEIIGGTMIGLSALVASAWYVFKRD